MITAMLLVMALLVLFQPDDKRTLIATIYVVCTMGHDIATRGLEGEAYYFSAMITEMAVIYLLHKIYPIVSTSISLIIISFISIIAHIYGLRCYRLGMQGFEYEVLGYLLYSGVIITLFWNSGIHARMRKLYSRDNSRWLHHN